MGQIQRSARFLTSQSSIRFKNATLAKRFLGVYLVEHYFDIETTGLDPERDKVITIQTQRLVGRTGEPIDEVNILKEWESSEKEIIYKLCFYFEQKR